MRVRSVERYLLEIYPLQIVNHHHRSMRRVSFELKTIRTDANILIVFSCEFLFSSSSSSSSRNNQEERSLVNLFSSNTLPVAIPSRFERYSDGDKEKKRARGARQEAFDFYDVIMSDDVKESFSKLASDRYHYTLSFYLIFFIFLLFFLPFFILLFSLRYIGKN